MVRRKWWRGQCHVGVGVYACVRARDYASYCAQVGGSCGRRRRRRRLGASARAGGGPGVSVPSWPGPAVAAWRGLWLRRLAPWRLRPARAAAGCKAGAAAAPVRGGFLFRFFLFFFLACGSGSGSGRGRESSRMVVSSPGLARAGKLGGVRHAGGPPRSAGQADDRGRRVVSTCFSRFFLSRKKTKGRNWNLEENCSSCHVAS